MAFSIPRTAAALLLVATSVVGLAACSSAPDEEATAPASLAGEWIVTRTVTSTNDSVNEATQEGTESERTVVFADVDCGSAECTGTVSSGEDADSLTETTVTVADNVASYEFSGVLACLRASNGKELSPQGYDYTQEVTLSVADSEEVDGVLTATALEGELVYADNLTDAGIAAGCSREFRNTTTIYSLTAVRA